MAVVHFTRERERERERETEGGGEAAFRLTVHACRYADLFLCAWSNVTMVLDFIPAIRSVTMVTLNHFNHAKNKISFTSFV